MKMLALPFRGVGHELYDADSPAPRCLRMFILEKGIRLSSVTVDVFAGENRQTPYLALRYLVWFV
jgi:glutathione S-transferase